MTIVHWELSGIILHKNSRKHFVAVAHCIQTHHAYASLPVLCRCAAKALLDLLVTPVLLVRLATILETLETVVMATIAPMIKARIYTHTPV